MRKCCVCLGHWHVYLTRIRSEVCGYLHNLCLKVGLEMNYLHNLCLEVGYSYLLDQFNVGCFIAMKH